MTKGQFYVLLIAVPLCVGFAWVSAFVTGRNYPARDSGTPTHEVEESEYTAAGSTYRHVRNFVPCTSVWMQIGTEQKLWSSNTTTIHCTPDALSPETKARCLAEWRPAERDETNTLQIVAANAVIDFTRNWIRSAEYPTHDNESGIGQGTCVKYVGPTNNAPPRIGGIVVSRIITDKTRVIGGGEKWCLVEFGEGPPWKGYALTNLVTMPVFRALADFPPKGIETVMSMLDGGRNTE